MKRTTLFLTSAVLFALFLAPVARAEFGLKDFSVAFKNEDGSPATQAGSHPFEVETTLNFNTKFDAESGKEVPDGDVKSLHLELPPGFIGSAKAVPRCASADFLTVDEDGYPTCPNATAVGATQLALINPGEPLLEPVYNLVPPPGVVAKIGFIAFNIPLTLEIGVGQEPPNNILVDLPAAPGVVEVYGGATQLWGIPAAHSHDPFRGHCLQNGPVDNYGELKSKGICNTGAEEVPFITMPRSCTGPLSTSYEALSWQEPNALPDKGSSQAPGMTGCSKLGFTSRSTSTTKV
jgi:hypothetical protein